MTVHTAHFEGEEVSLQHHMSDRQSAERLRALSVVWLTNNKVPKLGVFRVFVVVVLKAPFDFERHIRHRAGNYSHATVNRCEPERAFRRHQDSAFPGICRCSAQMIFKRFYAAIQNATIQSANHHRGTNGRGYRRAKACFPISQTHLMLLDDK